MATTNKKTMEAEFDSIDLQLEQRKVKALEKIANSLDALTVWFEEIEKQDWSDRMQFYLYEFHQNSVATKEAIQQMADSGTAADAGAKRPKKDSEK